ncbi:MAG TPA: hypothetical protein VEF04_18685 [Blastocatellia bacterium]|nr:hypothetical protein [Blastocatellia bacterium]
MIARCSSLDVPVPYYLLVVVAYIYSGVAFIYFTRPRIRPDLIYSPSAISASAVRSVVVEITFSQRHGSQRSATRRLDMSKSLLSRHITSIAVLSCAKRFDDVHVHSDGRLAERITRFAKYIERQTKHYRH